MSFDRVLGQNGINRHQQAVITYQREEIKALREMLGGNVCGSPMNTVAGLP